MLRVPWKGLLAERILFVYPMPFPTPQVDGDRVLYSSDCSIYLQDLELKDNRIMTISYDFLRIVSKSNPAEMTRIPLISITRLEKTIQQHPSHFIGGLPHLEIFFQKGEVKSKIMLWTTNPIWRADVHLRLAVQNALQVLVIRYLLDILL